MRILLALTVYAGALAAAPTAAPRPLVHPDTLPSLIEEWSLDASVSVVDGAPYVDAKEAASTSPRFTLDGDVLYVHDHQGAQLIALDATTGKVRWFVPLPKGKPSALPFRPYVHELRSAGPGSAPGPASRGEAPRPAKRLLVAGNRSLYYVRADSGQVVWRAPLPGAGAGAAYRVGDLLVFATVATDGKEAAEGPQVTVYALNLVHGKFAWHKRFAGAQVRLLADDRQIFALLPGGDLMALSPAGGDPLWRVRIEAGGGGAGIDGQVGDPVLAGGRLVVPVRGANARLLAIDTAEGATGGATGAKIAWEQRLAAARFALVPTAAGLLLVRDDGVVVAIDPVSGREAWRAETVLFGHARELAGVSDAKRAYLHLTQEDGRSLLSLVDLQKGRLIATANGLPQGATAAGIAGKVVVIDTADGVLRAFRVDRSDRPKRKVVTPVDFAKELAATAPAQKTPDAVATLAEKLTRLGPTVLPVVLPLLHAAEPNVAGVATLALGDLGDRKAAPDLVVALERERARKPAAMEPIDLVLAIVQALGKLGDPQVAPALEQVMTDASVGHGARRAAYVALGRLGTPEAIAAVARFEAPLRKAPHTWEPAPITPALTLPVGGDVDYETWPDDVRARTSITATDAAGKKVVASLSPYLGGYNDVWIWRSDDGRRWDRPLFTGITHAARAPRSHVELVRLDVRPTGVVLAYRLPGGGTTMRAYLEWKNIEKDSDGDGVTDLAEKRLGTKLDEKDSDGDGRGDAEDGNPNAPSTNLPSDDQLLYRQVFLAWFAFFRARGVVVVDRGVEARLEYPGRRDPVVTLRRRAMAKLQDEAGLFATDYVGFGGPFLAGGTRGEAQPEPEYNAARDQAVVGFDVFRGGTSAVGYNVTLRKIGDAWVVTAMDQAWRL